MGTQTFGALTFLVAALSLGMAGRAPCASAPFIASLADTDTLIILPAVEVNAARPENDSNLRLSPGFARAYDVSTSHGRLRMASDLLSGGVGVHVRQFGGIGAFSTVSIRGSSSGQVAVYLDGVPLNSAQYGVVNVADLPIEALDRIEVYRGGAPLFFQSPGGGVVNLVSRRVDGTWARASAGRGSFKTGKADATTGWRRGRQALLAVAQYLRSDGSFRYLDDNATPFNAVDDSLRTRQNNRLESFALTGRVEQGIGPLALTITHDHLSKQAGTPGTGANPAPKAHLRTDRDLTSVLLRRVRPESPHPSAAATDPALRLFMVRQHDRFADPDGKLTGLRQNNHDVTNRLGALLTAGLRLPLGQTVTAVGEARRERYAPRINLPTPRALPESERRFLAAGAEHRSTMFEERLALVGTVRRQLTFDDFGGGPPYPGALPVPPVGRTVYQTSWTAGTRMNVVPGVALKASFSRLARMPTLEELFGNRGGIYGNPRARPELIDTRDAGVVAFWSLNPMPSLLRPAWLEVQLSAYGSDATDLLVYIQNSQRSSVAQNISAARLVGAELSARAAWSTGLSTDFNWTRQWTRDEGDVVYWRGKALPGRPRDEGLVRTSLARRPWRAAYEFHFVSSNYLDRYNLSRIPPRSIHDFELGLSPWGTAFEWMAECRNISDQRVEDFAGYPLPGRMFYIGVRTRLDKKGTDHETLR